MRNKEKEGFDGEMGGKGKDGREPRTKICTRWRKEEREKETYVLETGKPRIGVFEAN